MTTNVAKDFGKFFETFKSVCDSCNLCFGTVVEIFYNLVFPSLYWISLISGIR